MRPKNPLPDLRSGRVVLNIRKRINGNAEIHMDLLKNQLQFIVIESSIKRKVLKVIPMLIANSFYRGIPMFRNYLKIAVRNLVRSKTYSIINIMGLSLGFGLCTVLLLYIHYELNYDRYHKNADQIYRVTTIFPGTTSIKPP